MTVALVIQTASGILTGRFAPREAVTLLATQGPQARAEAARLDPIAATRYAELVASVRAELAARPRDADLDAVLDDLDRLERALSSRRP
ncbi:MAG TPA: hypothetical protein VHF27_04715 [Acidimicrobiales bacterium]|nr:hypothetical protein [Acidimicrobiales bacterium]